MTLTNQSLRYRALQEARRHRLEQEDLAPEAPQTLHDDLKRPGEEEDCNIPLPRPRRDWSYWLCMAFVIAPIWLVTPLSWAYTLYVTHRTYGRIHHPSTTHSQQLFKTWELALFVYTTFEAVFSIYYQSLAYRAQNYKSRVPHRDIHELQLIFTRVLQTGLAPPLAPGARSRPQSPAELITTLKYDDPRAVDFRNHFRHWFQGAPWKDITRRAMSEWLSWSVFDIPLDNLDQIQKIVVEEALILIERRCGGRLREEPEPGKKHIKPYTLTWDPVVIWGRPGILYVLGELFNRGAKLFLEYRHGMAARSFDGIDYLIRAPDESGCTRPAHSPLVFMHGLGFGLAQYMLSVLLFMEYAPKDQPIMIPLQPHISQAILHPFHMTPLSRDHWVRALRGLFKKLRWDEEGVTMVSHSKGSLLHTWLLKAHPELIQRSCFIDPVCFCLWEGDLCHNFLYREPTNAVELIAKYFAATEPGIALAVQRHFDWSANALWFEEIPRARNPYYASFFIGGNDAIIDGWRVRRYLLNHGIGEGLNWDPEGQHGQPVLVGRGLRQLKAWLTASEPPPTMDEDSDSSDEDCAEVEKSVLL